MRIVCPSCDATYDVPAGVVAARRKVRCARCGADFPAIAAPEPGGPAIPEAPPAASPAQSPEPSPAAPPPEIRVHEAERLAPAIPPHLSPTQPRAVGKRAAAVLAGWALSLTLLGAAGWAGITWRDRVMLAWPPSTRLYAALGYTR